MMSLVSFSRIFGVNYNSLGEFDLEITPGRHLVIGENKQTGASNGSGKSSLFESLVKTIHNKYQRGNDSSYGGKGDSMTGATFDIGGKEYTIERYFKHPEFENTAKLYLDDVDISARITEDVNSEILKLIPIPHDLFVSTIVVMQGLPVNFTQFTANIRKTIFEEALNLPWDKYKSKFSKECKDKSVKRQGLDAIFRSKENEFSGVSAKIETLREAGKTNDAEISKKLDVVREELDKLNEQREGLISDLNELTGGEESDVISEKHNQLMQSMSKFTHELSIANSILRDKSCPTCTRPFPDEKMEKAAQIKDSLDQKIKMMKSRLTLAKQKLESVQKTEQEIRRIDVTLNLKKKESNVLGAEMDKVLSTVFNPELERLQKRFDVLYVELEEKQAEISTIDIEIENTKFIDDLLLPASQFRTQALLDYLGHVNRILRSVSPIIFPGVQVLLKSNAKVTGIDIQITRSGKLIDYKQLSGGEKRRLDVAIILAFQRFLIEVSGVKTNLVVLDEIMDALDREGIDSVINCLETLFPPWMCIYVISHNSELKSRFDSVIKVVKDQNGRSHLD
jgi:DNA repair exonuclease SbcCD ATPase subunit